MSRTDINIANELTPWSRAESCMRS